LSIELFYSYAQEDEVLRAELEKHLSLLKRQGYITGWHGRDISAGQEWEHEIDSHLNSAQIILLLVSPDFMASDYCYDIEVKRAIQRHESGEARVIPVILRPVDWHEAMFGKLKALPGDGKAVRLWPDRDAAFYDIARGIREVVQELSLTPSSLASLADSTTEQQKEPQAMPSTLHASSGNDPMQGLERPATAFLSYKREDAEEVKYLQQQLKVRGVRAWRDVTDLVVGGSTKDEITHAIEEESDAFVIYITQECFASDFIWNVEVPTALKRWERDHAFNIVPIFQGITVAEVQEFCAARSLRSLTDFNGVSLPDSGTGGTKPFNHALRMVAERILKATLSLRLRRVGADRDRKYEPYIYLQTFNFEPPAESLDLDLDWTRLFKSKDDVPTDEEWEEILFPALQDVKNVLSTKTPSRRLHVFVQAILPAAFALGYALPESAYFTLLLEGRHGTWSTVGSPSDLSPLRLFSYPRNGDAHIAIVEIAISRATALGATQSLSTLGLSFKHHIRFELPDGPDNKGVKDPAQALAMSQQIGQELRRLCDKEGVSHIHLFASLPAALAVMVGHQFNALGAITLYHYVPSDAQYIRVCTLGK